MQFCKVDIPVSLVPASDMVDSMTPQLAGEGKLIVDDKTLQVAANRVNNMIRRGHWLECCQKFHVCQLFIYVHILAYLLNTSS